MLSSLRITSKSLIAVSRCAFSAGSTETVASRSGKKTITDMRGMIYKPAEKMEFGPDGRCLLYYYRPRFYTFSLFYGKYWAPFAAVAYLIVNNPFYMTFPAALPLMVFTEVYLLRRIYLLKKSLRNTVSEVYLLRDGETLEIHYQNKLWRQLKQDRLTNLYYIPSMKTPEKDEHLQPLSGDLFPEEFPFTDVNPAGWSWSKYFRNPQNYLLLPKYANYKNMELLTAVFSGRIIDTSKQNVTEIENDKKEDFKFE